MKKLIALVLLAAGMSSCGGSKSENKTENAVDPSSLYDRPQAKADDEQKGIGKFTDVQLSEMLDHAKATHGEKVYDVKCQACHKLTDEKLVGPGWKEVTIRRKPEWILNFITNVDEMLSRDPIAMAQLEECLVRMPNQQLSDEDAYAVLEFMRKNDGVK
jgi:mono/diheme cytochrome c family protein